jgi:CRP-like cAMP-binding protein
MTTGDASISSSAPLVRISMLVLKLFVMFTVPVPSPLPFSSPSHFFPQGSEEFLTTLGPSQYFGEKFFLTNRTVTDHHKALSSHSPFQIQRNATVRAVTRTLLGVVYPKDFYLWHKFRTFLLMKAVPLIRTLPQSDQLEMYSLLQHQEFQDGDYIIRQGDVGDKFYIITGGAADVVEEAFDGFYFRRDVLTRLYEGHFFGEMAIIYDEPRCVDSFLLALLLPHSPLQSCKCGCCRANLMSLSFQSRIQGSSLDPAVPHDDAGRKVDPFLSRNSLQNVAYERTLVRERREKTNIAKLLSHETSSSTEDTLPLQSPSFRS